MQAAVENIKKTSDSLMLALSRTTDILASVAEDGLVAVLVALAMAYPKTATVIAVLAAVIGVLVAILLWKFAKRGLRRVRGWLQQRRPATS